MKVQALVLVIGSLAVASGCGRGSGSEDRKAAGSAAAGSAGSAAVGSAAAGSAAATPASDASGASGGAGGDGALATCSDGDLFAGARISATDARFCVEGDGKRSCWRVELGGAAAGAGTGAGAGAGPGGITAVADLGPVGAVGEVDVPALAGSVSEVGAPKPAAGAADQPGWSATFEGEVVKVCGPAGCQPLALQPPLADGDDRTGVQQVAISKSGARVAVSRGVETVTPTVLELYDRAAGKKLGAVRARTLCAHLDDFIGETAVLTEWDCANQGGDHLLISPAGKLVARVEGMYPHGATNVQVDGDRWAFLSYEAIALHDIASGKRLAVLSNPEAHVAAAHRKLYVFDPRRVELTVYASDGAQLVKQRAPTCRYEWETETLGALSLSMPTAALAKVLGAPKRKTKPDPQALYASTWSYASGVTLGIEASNVDPNFGGPVLPYRVVRIVVTAPSALRTGAGIGIGSSFDELMAAYGSHIVRTRSDADRFFVGNDAQNDLDGLVFWTTGGKVSKILLGSMEGRE